MYLYAYVWNLTKEPKINKIMLWFIRLNKSEEFPYLAGDEAEALQWFTEEVKEIKADKEWIPNSGNTYFCGQICGHRMYCPFSPHSSKKPIDKPA